VGGRQVWVFCCCCPCLGSASAPHRSINGAVQKFHSYNERMVAGSIGCWLQQLRLYSRFSPLLSLFCLCVSLVSLICADMIGCRAITAQTAHCKTKKEH
jgi:hypothetical protein